MSKANVRKSMAMLFTSHLIPTVKARYISSSTKSAEARRLFRDSTDASSAESVFRLLPWSTQFTPVCSVEPAVVHRISTTVQALRPTRM
jgi:hypothetical protein